MNTARRHAARLAFLSAALLALNACASLKPSEAPFHLFNSGMLNEDRASTYARGPEPNRVPAEPIAWSDDAAGEGDGAADTRVAATSPAKATPVKVSKAKPKPKPKDAPVKVAAAPKVKTAKPKDAPVKVAAAPAKSTPVKTAAAPVKTTAAPVKTAANPIKTDGPVIAYSPRDAVGYIGAICELNEVSIDLGRDDNAIAELYAFTEKRGRVYQATRPAVGDLVFFHNTYDRNNDGRNNDWYTHVGIVEDVEDDGTIHFLSFYNGSVAEDVLNLEHPSLAMKKSSQTVWNTTLRRRTAQDPPFTQHLASELFAGFGNILGNRTEFDILDSWAPDTVVSSR